MYRYHDLLPQFKSLINVSSVIEVVDVQDTGNDYIQVADGDLITDPVPDLDHWARIVLMRRVLGGPPPAFLDGVVPFFVQVRVDYSPPAVEADINIYQKMQEVHVRVHNQVQNQAVTLSEAKLVRPFDLIRNWTRPFMNQYDYYTNSSVYKTILAEK